MKLFFIRNALILLACTLPTIQANSTSSEKDILELTERGPNRVKAWPQSCREERYRLPCNVEGPFQVISVKIDGREGEMWLKSNQYSQLPTILCNRAFNLVACAEMREGSLPETLTTKAEKLINEEEERTTYVWQNYSLVPVVEFSPKGARGEMALTSIWCREKG